MSKKASNNVIAEKSRAEFQKRREDIIQSLEANYTVMMGEKDKYGACEVLCSLMEYRGIEKDDSRLKLLDKENFDIESARDYRRKCDNTSKFVWCAIPSRIKFEANSKEHASKRVEGNYEGDITVGSRDVVLIASEVIQVGAIKRLPEKLVEIEKRNGMPHFNLGDNFVEDTTQGRFAVYEVRVQSGHNFLRSIFGYMLVSCKADDSIMVYVFPDYEALNTCYIQTRQFVDELSESFKAKVTAINEDVNIRINTIKRMAV